MRTLKISILLVCLLQGSILLAQTSDVDINNDKATVFIVRSSAIGALINYKYFIDETYLGKCKYGYHLKLELDPGEYLLWVKAENRSFVEAKVEAGKTYYVNAVARMGMIKSAVKLVAVNNESTKDLIKIKKSFLKSKIYEFDGVYKDEEDKQKITDLINNSLQDYESKLKFKKDIGILDQPVSLDYIQIPDKKKKRKDKKRKKKNR
jgi:hypothetical protein